MASLLLDFLPDSLLLRVIAYLDYPDRQSVAHIGTRYKYLCYDMTIVRQSNFEGCYTMQEDDLKDYVQLSCGFIRVLNLNHCYWLTQKCLQSVIKKCYNLQELHVIQCRLCTTALVSLLVELTQLNSLSFSIDSFTNIKKETFHPARMTLKSLKAVCIYYSSRELTVMNFLGEQLTLLDYCESLRELVINSAEISIPELCRPVLTRPDKLDTIRSMSLSSNIHAAAHLLFYGTLSALANLKIPWEMLLMPNVNFSEFSQKPEYKECLKHIDRLKYLDISGSFQPVDRKVLNILSAHQLRYYNVSMTKIRPEHLLDIASTCHHLISLNIFECSHAFFEQIQFDVSGLIQLLRKCSHLRHLNIGGIHFHAEAYRSSVQMRKIISEIKGLRSLGLAVCMLCDFKSIPPAKPDWGKRSVNVDSPPPPKKSCQDSRIPFDSDDTECSRGSDSKPVFDEICCRNPELSCLEIISVGFSSSFHKNKFIKPREQQFNPCAEVRMVRDFDLLSISQLKHLVDLTIIGAPSLKGNCLVEIAKCCGQLERLSLGFIGEALTMVNNFSRVLAHLKSIRDIRLEQPYMSLDSAFFCSLSKCRRIQRLCIIAKQSHYNPNCVMRSMDELSLLVVLQIFSAETLIGCHKLSTAIKKRFCRTRPALSICIFPLLHDDIQDVPKLIPAKHFNELTRFSSSVSSLPPPAGL